MIEFGYENRNVPLKTHIYGSQVLINKLLNLITIKYGAAPVGKLQLVYTNSKLGEIIKFGKNNTRLNSTFVNWGSTDAGLVESTKTVIAPLTGRLQGDFNGDGRTDLALLNLQPTNPPTFINYLYLADNWDDIQNTR